MGLFKSIGDFLFGKNPDIFDENGKVRHKFPDSKWQKWNERLQANPEYDWRKHSAKLKADGKNPTGKGH
ncbi:MAG: hypothetical protein AAB250_01550 [Bdellovibrionota bacterium]